MKGLILLLALVGVLLFAGCSSGPQVSTKAPEPSVPTVTAPAKNVTVPPKPTPAPTVMPEPPAVNATPPAENGTPQLSPDSCTVQFQKDPQGVYYVMVDTSSQKELAVMCPNAKAGERQGNLYLCNQLDIAEPVVAYLGGKECGRAYFDRASVEKKSGSKTGCTLLIAPSRITAGQTSTITIWTSSGDREVNLTFNCGSETKSQKRSGLVTDGAICQFDTPGTIEVDAKIDGELCASRLLEVFAKSRDCSVYGSTFARKGNDYSYSATVAGRGYNTEDEMKYTCYDTPNTIAVGQLENSTDFVTTIECRGTVPLAQPIPIRIRGDACGEIELPQAQ